MNGHGPAPERGSRFAMSLLAQHIPLTLLLDLADPAGPDSAFILQSERRNGQLPPPRVGALAHPRD